MLYNRTNKRWVIWGVLVFVLGLWMYICLKTIVALSPNDQRGFILRLILFLAIPLFVSIKRRTKKANHDEIASRDSVLIKSTKSYRSYQEIVEEHNSYLEKLKSYRYWTYGCFLIALILFIVFYISHNAQLTHPGFTTFVFCVALLLGTKDLEKQRDVDIKVIECTLKGLQAERRLNSDRILYFGDFIKCFEGPGMLEHAFVRISPTLMLVFSLINFGLTPLLYIQFPTWMENIILVSFFKGVLFSLAALGFGKLATNPYRYLLVKNYQSIKGQ